MKIILCLSLCLAIAAAGYYEPKVTRQCHTYEQCQGYGQGRPVLCFSGECRYRVPCNKDNDCAFYGISDMEYSIKQGYPLVAMCLKVSRPRAYGYGQCFLKPAHIVNDETLWPSRLAGSDVMRALNRTNYADDY